MVNVPPIPPLLCSTPPPIDFGEDDEYVDELPPTLDGVVDDDFGDFLTVDDANTNEPLPSPRPPSVCDLPAVSIYDGLIPPPEENLKNHATIPSSPTPPPTPEDSKISKNSKNTTKSINITEAFNFKVKSTYEEESKTLEPKGESNNSSMETKATDGQPNTESLQIETNDLEKLNSQMESLDIIQNPTATPGLSKNVKDLTIETSNNEAKCNSNKTNLNCMQNMVSIEDIEDDLSDDELYSPKTPKNFIETDNLNDYFKIEEIKTTTNTGNLTKVNSKDVDAKSLDSLDNNESASIGNDNDNEFKSFSSNSFMQNNYDMPPPLQDDTNSIDDDDFGDFADFQDFQDFSTSVTPAETQYFVNNTVPVSDINNKQQHNDDLEFNGFNDFNNYNTTRETTNVNTNNEKQEDVEENNTLKDSKAEESDKFELYTSHSNALPDSIEERSKQYTLANEIITQEMPQDNNSKNINKVSSTVENPSEDFNEENKERSHLDNSFGDFNSATVNKGHDNDEDDFGNFAEFSKPTQNLLRENTEVLKNIEEPKECSPNTTNDEEFDDFADFESHEVNLNTEQTANEAHTFTNNEDHNVPELNDVEEDDDDFGDFNTAQPITPTASSLTLTKTSQNITAATTALPPTHNLNERISKILQLMFTPAITQAADESADELKTDKIQDIPFTSIDAAKALEYQWLNSDTRHSFIRALGIDSRNILFGENWNPSLPRFAANLSFNPLKPMKPVQSSSSAADSNTMLEPIPIISESTKTLDVTGSVKKESFDLDWKPTNTQEQTTEAFKETTVTPVAQSATPITSVPPVTNEPSPAEPVSLTIFENPLENEDKFSKTPPISEMESIPTFSSPLPTNNLDMELEASQNAGSNLDDFVMKDIEDNLKNTLNINEVVVTSTFTGSFKETHIYTPPKTSDFEVKTTTGASTTSSSPSKVSPIDFDYEKAAMGVIINETVVKKEYRDVEYNPPFSMESLSKSVTNKSEMFESNYPNNSNTNNIIAETDVAVGDEQESSDDFSEFQSVPTEVIMPTTKPVAVNNTKPLEVPKPTTVSHGGMILSPAILIPQAISLEQQKPKIEWGDSTATINPEELARIEELFPEPKSLKSSNGSNSSQKSTPTHQVASTPSISATVANKELEGNLNDDDDDWSDFVSVTVTNNASANRLANNNNILAKSPAGSPFKQRSPVVNHRMPPATHHNNSNNDDEWSDFVSSAPPSQQSASYRIPQFNSGAWQNANFYNNPLSMYHKGPLNVPSTAPATNPTQKTLYNNNNNYNISQQPYQITNNLPSLMVGNNQQMQQPPNNVYQQQIHVMQNFSTAPVPTPERLSAAANAAKNNQFQSIGSAKVAPSIALIPDLGFVAPAIPTHTSFINSLPKPSINTKK
ncbi:aftiphilin [Lucilia sericata]|uniref:aftiphilin n=1 Tax=Lucilia sericata TaxID=13632 RepID=UPI0018A85EF3|nr:aftiphilin [Lucilia sericata]XP_037815632.1 aftiphilin [Lucilia sericata]